mmetsp:Transcript_9977/g.23816  ORF Transcript_9977/g.23816 Transcript_9977/m.23816 type:complete len:319 (-) Transcript_9977:297-1253(-)
MFAPYVSSFPGSASSGISSERSSLLRNCTSCGRSRLTYFRRSRVQKDRWSRNVEHHRVHAIVGIDTAGILSGALDAHPGVVTGVLCNSAVYLAGNSVLRKGLTPSGIIHSWFLGSSIYAAFGLKGYSLVCLYFIVGSAVTKLKIVEKEALGIAEARSGRRSPWSVWGSGLAGLLCAFAAMLTSDFNFWQVGFVASFASKLSDTVSSEVGKAYGKTTYLATTLQVVPRGTEGAVSLEGSLAGVGSAVLFVAAAFALGQIDPQGAAFCVAAAVAANYFESCLGATSQASAPWLTNDVVNMIQITVAAATALGLQGAFASG